MNWKQVGVVYFLSESFQWKSMWKDCNWWKKWQQKWPWFSLNVFIEYKICLNYCTLGAPRRRQYLSQLFALQLNLQIRNIFHPNNVTRYSHSSWWCWRWWWRRRRCAFWMYSVWPPSRGHSWASLRPWKTALSTDRVRSPASARTRSRPWKFTRRRTGNEYFLGAGAAGGDFSRFR